MTFTKHIKSHCQLPNGRPKTKCRTNDQMGSYPSFTGSGSEVDCKLIARPLTRHWQGSRCAETLWCVIESVRAPHVHPTAPTQKHGSRSDKTTSQLLRLGAKGEPNLAESTVDLSQSARLEAAAAARPLHQRKLRGRECTLSFAQCDLLWPLRRVYCKQNLPNYIRRRRSLDDLENWIVIHVAG